MYQLLGRISRGLPPSRTKVRLGKLHCRAAPAHSAIPVTMRDGTVIVLDPRCRTEGTPFWDGLFDEHTVAVLKACTEFGRSVYDVGANVGLIGLPLARRLRGAGGGTVTFFDPVPENFSRILDGISLNGLSGTTRALNTALGDSDGEIRVTVESRRGSLTGNASIFNGAAPGGGVRVAGARIQPLDAVVEREGLPLPDVIKIDVEGAETLVLSGAEGTIQRQRPIILGEFHAGLMPGFGHTFLDVAAKAKAWNYRIYKFVRDYRLDLVTEPKAGMGNALLAPAERAGDLEGLFLELDRKSPT